MTSPCQPVLVLGAGINGAALARELLLSQVPVVLVDTADLCAGTTAFSSRLIHGGLRYLEYGDFQLVRESLVERTRLLQLAPDFVRPLRLFIPSGRRLGGLGATLRRLVTGREVPTTARGMWLVRLGLWFYDRYARDRLLPRHSMHQVGAAATPHVDAQRYRWLCAYSDAQVLYPERLVVALLADAERAAEETGVSFDLLTYHEATLSGRRAEVRRQGTGEDPVLAWEPAAIVNATGAWVDHTLRRMNVPSPPLMGGTKGSHFVTYHQGLCDALGGMGVYVEADDGRPIFVLPLDQGVLVGTTDLPFEGDPAEAIATEAELEYLIENVNRIFSKVTLSRDDVAFHYSGVRPLPESDSATPGAITRRHRIDEHPEAPLPFFSLVGGKLTTCRSLAEEATRIVIERLGLPRRGDSRERAIPGGDAFPPPTATEGEECLDGTDLPTSVARWVIDHEWVTTLDDLVERRLMLLYHPRLTTACLHQLSTLLAAAGKLPPDAIDRTVADTIARLGTHFGKRVEP